MTKKLLTLCLIFNPWFLWGAANQYIQWPASTFRGVATVPSYINTAMTIDAAGEQAAWIMQAPATGDIVKVHLRYGSVVTGATVTMGFYILHSSAGIPNTEIPFPGHTPISHDIDAGQDNQMVIATMTASVVIGDTIAVVVTNSVAAPGNIQHSSLADDGLAFPYQCLNVGSGWTKNSNGLVIALEYSDGSFYHMDGVHPYRDITSVNVNENLNHNIRGIWFIPNMDIRVVGAWVWMDQDADANLNLYDPSDLTLMSMGLPNATRQAANANIQSLYFNKSVNLKVGSKYHLAIQPVNGATNVGMYEIVAASNVAAGSAGILIADPNSPDSTLRMGTAFKGSDPAHRTWIDLSTTTMAMGLIIDRVNSDRGSAFSQ